MENTTDADLSSFEGKYPKDLFNKNVEANGQAIGRIAKETDDTIVVFSDSGNLRFDIPKSKIEMAGGSVIVKEEALDQYVVDKDAPLPESGGLRPSAEEIIQKAGEIPERPSASVPGEQQEYRQPSAVEEKAIDIADDVTDEFKGVGRELEQAAKTAKGKMEEIGATAASDMEEAARQAASSTSSLARSGARAAKEKIVAAQSNTEAGLSSDNILKIEKESRQPSTEVNLGSYEGKYPKDLFNRTVLLNNQQPVGRVVRETDDIIVVFSDTDSSIRFDIPKSEVTLAGGSIVANEDLLFRYRKRRDDPIPPGRALRPSGKEIRAAAAEQVVVEAEQKKRTTPDAVMQQGDYLAAMPPPETTVVSRPEGYVGTESELSKKVKGALAELKEIIVAGTKVAKKKAKQAQLQAAEKQAEMDAAAISRMGGLSARFADSFEEILSEIRTRTYADQEQIYTGFLKLMDTQRELVVARRDLARRLKDSVNVPVVDNNPQLDVPPELPEDVSKSRTLTEGRNTTTTKTRRTRKTIRKRKS
ncbi:MAG: hypothetical protein QXX64_00415 [Nitrososphaera sp.]|uniref:Uncharacterized protein n=1 Tax=Nitrososphaera gargensis (strain Ga9.2) TaxID=1237085 RepID=K0IDR2_NITGG|nr:hypothetical protein [Candidatus Nitrososphaera gargensis]AFU56953.1 hypothetical protein Ngar_c00030 [Candidatus Nitrososphaera gargensis Ga9.2]